MIRKFPKDFLFGGATAAYQVEGNLSGERDIDWDEYLKHHSEKHVITKEEVGPDWWELPQLLKDMKVLAHLGLNAQRIGIEWGRVMPREGEIDYKVLDHYRLMVDDMQKFGMDVMITLEHFTLPAWIADMGGWENRKTEDVFKEYVDLIINRFPDIIYWITINEPTTEIGAGYLVGYWPPGKKSLLATLMVSRHLIQANAIAYELIKKRIPKSQVGVANAMLWAHPHDEKSFLDKEVVKVANILCNDMQIGLMKNHADFIGINYYATQFLKFNPSARSAALKNNQLVVKSIPGADILTHGGFITEWGWEIVPEGLLEVLEHVYNKYKKPIIITENGIADKEDKYRGFYILTHLYAVQKALENGIDVRGYYYWSSIDNQEWMAGFKYHFGLIGLDPKSRKRGVRKSAFLYSDIIRAGYVDIEKLSKEYLPLDQQKKLEEVIQKM